MPRYFQSYDAYGEPVTIIRTRASESDELSADVFEAAVLAQSAACIDADFLYETLRENGASHEDARAAIKERFEL